MISNTPPRTRSKTVSMIGSIHLLVLFLTIAMAGCSDSNNSSLSTAELVGVYWGRYGGGDETFEIFEDGTFSQTFRVGTNTVYAIKGTWKFEEHMTTDGKWQTTIGTNGIFEAKRTSRIQEKVKVDRVTFKPFMIPRGVHGQTSEAKVEVGVGQWIRKPIRIEFGPWPYHVSKVKGEGATIKVEPSNHDAGNADK
jgi:hypothetical protein